MAHRNSFILAAVLIIAATSFAGTWLASPGKGSHASASSAALGSATFDGSGDRLSFPFTADVTSMSGAGKVFTASFWVNTDNNAATAIIAQGRSGTSGPIWRLQIANTLVFLFQSSAPATIVSGYGDVVITNNTWHHVMISFDASNASARHIYIDGVEHADTWENYANTAVALNRSNIYVGTDDDFDSDFAGCIAQLWIDDVYIDLSNASNRQKFYNGGPVDMGTDGNLTGAGIPNTYLRFVSGSLSTNSGSAGGTATITGGVANGDCGTVE